MVGRMLTSGATPMEEDGGAVTSAAPASPMIATSAAGQADPTILRANMQTDAGRAQVLGAPHIGPTGGA